MSQAGLQRARALGPCTEPRCEAVPATSSLCQPSPHQPTGSVLPWPENTCCPWLPVAFCPLRAQETGFWLFSPGAGGGGMQIPQSLAKNIRVTLCSGQHLAVHPLARIAKQTGFGMGCARGSVGLHAWGHWQQRWSQGAALMGRGPAHPPTRLSAGWGMSGFQGLETVEVGPQLRCSDRW